MSVDRLNAPDRIAFALGESFDYLTDPWFRVDAVGQAGACSFSTPAGCTKDDAFRRMGELQAEHPEYTRWAVLKFVKYVRVTKEDLNGTA